MKYWLAIAYCDIHAKKERDTEAFGLAGAPESGRGFNVASPNSRDLDFLYDTTEAREAAKQRFREAGFAIVDERTSGAR